MAIKYTKWPQNIPNGHKITKWPQNYQMAVILAEWSYNIPASSTASPSKIFPKLDFWYEIAPSGNPDVHERALPLNTGWSKKRPADVKRDRVAHIFLRDVSSRGKWTMF
jgi:hypothetical protein